MVGLDVGSKTVKVVELEKEGGKFRLRASGIFSHSEKTPEFAKEEKDLVRLVDGIKRLFKEAKVSSRDVSIALPETSVFTKAIRFPLLTEAEVASAVKWEAEQYIPIPTSEAIVQHQILEKREDSNPPHVLVLLIAAPKDLVEKYLRLVEMCGFNIVTVETELLALVRALAPENYTSLIVDLGARSSNIAIARNAQLIFTRTFPTAGEAFTRALAQRLSIEEMQAEEYKRVYGLSPSQLEGKVKSALEPVFHLVADEIRKSIHFYSSEEKGESPKQVILSGGSSGMPEIATSLTKLLGIEVVIGNPFSKVEFDPEAAKSLSGYAQFYGVAVGLALRGG